MFFNNSFYIASHGAAINFLIWTSSPFFFFRFFYLSTWFLSILTIESSDIHWLTGLTKFFPSFWLFLVLFWMLWMLVTVFKPCHMPHASQITTWGTLFTERLFSVSKEWVRSWSHTSLIIYDKTFAKKLKAVCPKSCWEGEKEKEKERQLQSVMH